MGQLAATDALGVASSNGALSLSRGFEFACPVPGDSRARMPAKFANDCCGEGVLQKNGGRLPLGSWAAPLLQDHRQCPPARRITPVDVADSPRCRSRR